MDPLFPAIPEDFSALSADELRAFIEGTAEAIKTVAADPAAHVNEERSSAKLREEMTASVEALEAAKAALKEREAEEEEPDDEFADIADLAARATLEAEETPAEEEPAEEAPAEETPAEEAPAEDETPAEGEATTAAAETPAPRVKPARARRAAPAEPPVEMLPLTAAAGAYGIEPGTPYGDELEIAQAMIRRRGLFGNIPDGTRGEKVPVAHADWRGLYPEDRVLGGDEIRNMNLIAAVTDPAKIRSEFDRRRSGDPLVASGGLCAPVTPYYQLQMLSQGDRPVRAALPSFAADRGGIRYATPPSLAAITTAVGTISAANDLAGGTFATKACQVLDCPDWSEVDVATIYHCLQFGNLGARTFPERVAHYNQLVLAAQARLAESALLTAIDAASTQVTAAAIGLGASATLPSQILAAAAGMRNRHRMAPDAVLRVLLPQWVLDLLVSDMYRTQFQRFDMSQSDFVSLLRAGGVEPSFYIDGASGHAQVFGAQNAGALLPFPPDVVWYLYPEGSFLFLDGGVLELGLVRDSVLNATNDFQIFGETFENVAFIGVESLAVTTNVCDSGTVSLPNATDCPIDYTRVS